MTNKFYQIKFSVSCGLIKRIDVIFLKINSEYDSISYDVYINIHEGNGPQQTIALGSIQCYKDIDISTATEFYNKYLETIKN